MARPRPAEYPPQFDAREFVDEPTDPADERIEVGILIVGAGPAGLACAIRLGQLIEESPRLAERLGEVPVAVLEKGKQPGSHSLSGAVVNPRSLRRLFRGEKRAADMPFYGEVEAEGVYFLRHNSSMRIPTPPTMKNHGNYVASLSQLTRWLAEQAEEAGRDDPVRRRSRRSCSSRTDASSESEPATRDAAASASGWPTSSRARTSSRASRSSARGRRAT